ncbi:hypothetical protein ACVJMZ_005604 [Sinorhizobium medicae]
MVRWKDTRIDFINAIAIMMPEKPRPTIAISGFDKAAIADLPANNPRTVM